MKRLLVILAVILLFGVAGATCSAAIQAIGDPILGGSWAQTFEYSGAPTDLIGVNWVGTPGFGFDGPAFDGFSDSSWADLSSSSGMVLTAVAAGAPTSTLLSFQLWFTPDEPGSSVVVSFDLVAFALGSETEVVERTRATWSNEIGGVWKWTYTPGDFRPTRDELLSDPVIPEPSTLVIWCALFGLGAAVSWWRPRRRSTV